jgi:hypothetical protein
MRLFLKKKIYGGGKKIQRGICLPEEAEVLDAGKAQADVLFDIPVVR